MDEAQRRKAANEAVFREVNERIEALHRRFELSDEEPLSIVCECDRIDCTERLDVTVELYERTRADSARFFVVPGHDDPTVESVIESSEGYLVVRKHPGEPRQVAAESDPRA
ncbi:MAG TPA: hypothetical protein VFU56_05250 [Gaiellaceae bacterium]|nr:hypothetical protein [Gaiellaceae bacterium]